MTAKRVVLAVQARVDLRHITAWYREQGGAALTARWVDDLQTAFDHLSTHPQAGSARYAAALRLDGLRCWPVTGWPFLIFYVERAQHIDVGRVLHAQRDIPAWLRESAHGADP